MKPMTPRARLKRLRAELRYTQEDNRVTATLLELGRWKAKRIGREMRAVWAEISAGNKTTKRKPGGEPAE